MMSVVSGHESPEIGCTPPTHRLKLEYALFPTLTTLQIYKGYPVYGLFTIVS